MPLIISQPHPHVRASTFRATIIRYRGWRNIVCIPLLPELFIMKEVFFSLIICISINASAQSTDEIAIRKILDDQTVAWNHGDVDGFMKGYWQNDSLMFIGKNGIT